LWPNAAMFSVASNDDVVFIFTAFAVFSFARIFELITISIMFALAIDAVGIAQSQESTELNRTQTGL